MNILLCYSVLDFSFISVGVVCLCLCAHAPVCFCIHTHAQEHMWTQKLVVDIFLSCYLPYFWDRVSYWTWSSPAYLCWLWSSYYFHSAGITDVSGYVCVVVGVYVCTYVFEGQKLMSDISSSPYFLRWHHSLIILYIIESGFLLSFYCDKLKLASLIFYDHSELID